MSVRVQQEPFDPGAELAAFDPGPAGAVVSFTGIVRDPGGLRYMEIEHYPAMTTSAIMRHVDAAKERWPLTNAMVIHRYGKLAPGEVIMMVATASAHRVAAFDAASFLMDFLKSRAPFWKKEVSADGVSWVDAKPEDEDALARWV